MIRARAVLRANSRTAAYSKAAFDGVERDYFFPGIRRIDRAAPPAGHSASPPQNWMDNPGH
jgi:hypothetical protein